MKSEQGDKFDINRINLAEMERRTGMTRAQLRRLKKNDFQITPHALTGRKADTTIISGYTGVIDDLLKKGVSNSEVILERIQEQGFQGSLTTVKRYIQSHKYLIPPKRQTVAPQGNRGRRYSSDAGESYQMDWGFVNVDTGDGTSYKVACFAMICHHCGERYIEFFPNAKQENLFIGMIHAFKRMGVLTDNMKSVVLHRDSEGHPVWNHDYEAFMNTIGFETKLCRPRHPFTKGSVERLVRFVKENFLAGRVFGTITDLNYEAWKWCDNQNNRYHKAVDCIPHERHSVLLHKYLYPVIVIEEQPRAFSLSKSSFFNTSNELYLSCIIKCLLIVCFTIRIIELSLLEKNQKECCNYRQFQQPSRIIILLG